jgi:hypothetical protein
VKAIRENWQFPRNIHERKERNNGKKKRKK